MKVDVQFSPAVETWPSLLAGVRVADEVGFDTVWVFDHLAGAMIGGTTMLECFTLLGALAVATERIGLGSLVVNVNNRNPGMMAAAASSVQVISAGRLILGLGAGAAPASRWSAEHRALGIDLLPTIEARHARLAAVLDELDRLWAADRPDELATFARPEPRPPVILGVNSTTLAALCGRRCDGVNVRGDHQQLAEILGAATSARLAANRAGEPFDVSVWARWDAALLDPAHPQRQRWESLGITRLILVFLEHPHDAAELRAAGRTLSSSPH